jgi:hypothetical protein|tara:strand:+ start:3066 stop:3191 length:126 start_codon:yes stop_codon:yes gene_type:complete
MGGSRYDELRELLKEAEEKGDEDKIIEIQSDLEKEFPDDDD